MSPVRHFLLHGLVVASEIELPAPRIAACAPDVTYHAALGAPLPAPSHSRSDDADGPWVFEHWMGRRLAVEFPGQATFELSRAEIVLVRNESNDPDLLVHLVIHHVLPRVVALRGDLMLHAAGAVSPAGRAYLFLGSAGTGKSTLVTGLVSEGWLLLDDDGIRLTPAGEAFVAYPGSAAVALLPDVSARLVPELEPGRPIAYGSDKRRFAIDGKRLRAASAAAPVAGVFVLTRARTEELPKSQLSFAAALGEIARHGYHLADEPSVIPVLAFEHASALAAAAPAWQIVVPSRRDDLMSARELIAALDVGS